MKLSASTYNVKKIHLAKYMKSTWVFFCKGKSFIFFGLFTVLIFFYKIKLLIKTCVIFKCFSVCNAHKLKKLRGLFYSTSQVIFKQTKQWFHSMKIMLNFKAIFSKIFELGQITFQWESNSVWTFHPSSAVNHMVKPKKTISSRVLVPTKSYSFKHQKT